MLRNTISATLAVAISGTPVPAAATTRRHHHHLAPVGHHGVRSSRRTNGYSSPVSPTVTCRYPDGTPYDPDVIGGPNHVGDGGPAANFGGFDPCAF